ncbi:MAG: AAA family ATPase [Bacteriovoracaceae bacterium]|nr:AAA family ATPase [Bacteriovoracaceae bacterium]
MSFFGREEDLEYLNSFVREKGSGFIYVRGRRRVGKSALLEKFQEVNTNCFYYMGAQDSTSISTKKDMATKFDQFSRSTNLSSLKTSALSWSTIFETIGNYAKQKQTTITLIFDEIQWIAKTGSGFVGNLKQAWLSWEETGFIKVIICGSSNKFFENHTGGEEKILRGIVTYATLWVKPFTLSEVKRYFFPKWSNEEVCLTYMMLGGIPYYLIRLDHNQGFMHAINSAIFTSKTIFLQEVDEILSLDFNATAKANVKKVMASLGQDGTSQDKIVRQTGLAQSTISGLISKLLDYKIVYKKVPIHCTLQKQSAGAKYYIKDFYLNFYFQILAPLAYRIQSNKSGLLFPYECIQSNRGFYIPNFSGKAFELLVQYILESRSLAENIFKKLLLSDPNYSISTYWDKYTQIDIVVEHSVDRISRIIECKWVSSSGNLPSKAVDSVVSKKFPTPTTNSRKNYLVYSLKTSATILAKNEKSGVGCIFIDDLFI